jgi:lysophospholipase L1-like esterase
MLATWSRFVTRNDATFSGRIDLRISIDCAQINNCVLQRGRGGGALLPALAATMAGEATKRPRPTPEQVAAFFAERLGETAGVGCESTGVLFFGDSDISNWDVWAAFPSLRLARCGVGGAQMSHIAAFTPTAMERYRGLDAIVVVAGENDLPSLSAEAAFSFFQGFLAAVRAVHPTLPVLYICTKPEPRTTALHEKYTEYDGLIRALCNEDPHLAVVGSWEAFFLQQQQQQQQQTDSSTDRTADPTLFVDDMLHLSAEGYAIWNAWVAEHLVARGIQRQAAL